MPVDPTAVLRADHRQVERLLQQIADSEPVARPPLVEELTTALEAHMELEERLLYPVVADELGREEEMEGESEHELARIGLAKVVELSPDGPGFMAALDMLKAGISHHVEDEETEMFPELNEQLDAARLEQLDAELTAARERLGLPTREDLADGTKAELYEKAKEADVPGRSSMTRDELAEAVPPGD
ncbi:MAG TPA: hemerythrin domain-containing protein [Acidimicrobiales bacterium]